MLYVDLDRFWKDDSLAHKENCFYKDSPQAALGLRMNYQCVYAELGEEGNPWAPIDPARQTELNKRYNEKAIKIVGKKLLPEEYPSMDETFPEIKKIGEVFEGKYEFNGISTWLNSSLEKTPKELEKLLDRVEKLNLREFLLPENWESEKNRIFSQYGKKPSHKNGSQGPVTLACLIYGAENLIYLIMDNPELAKRFSSVICDVIIGRAKILYEEAGYNDENRPHGFKFYDDDCALLSPEMYEMFGYPVLKRIFEYFCPSEKDQRYQHSDSSMGHLLPILGRLNLTECNFGPTVLADEIRKHMPKTRINGCIAPFTFMNNDEKAIIKEVKRDCEMVRKSKGINIATAGSVNNGSLLTSMRAVMYAIQNFGRY